MTLLRAIALAICVLIPANMPTLAHQADGRTLGMFVTAPQNGDPERATMLAHSVGVTRVPITYAWGALEPAPGEYDDSNLALAALFFPAMGMSIDIAITPIASNRLVMPKDLQGRAFDDPVVIERYLELIDHVMNLLAGAEVNLLLLGVEIDAYLGNDADGWDAFAAFTSAAASYVHAVQPGLEVGVQSTTYSRIVDPARWSAIDAATDVIATSYYPLDGLMARDPGEIGGDFDALTSLYPDRVIRIVEAGFPSSSANGSSPELQAAFVRQLFAAWDEHAAQIRSITLSVEHDYAPGRVDAFRGFYGDQREHYSSFIGSIGLRTWHDDGSPKPAWDALTIETAERGWHP